MKLNHTKFQEGSFNIIQQLLWKFHNIFITNHSWLVIVGYNLNLSLKLLFCPTNNNLSLKICCKNIVDI